MMIRRILPFVSALLLASCGMFNSTLPAKTPPLVDENIPNSWFNEKAHQTEATTAFALPSPLRQLIAQELSNNPQLAADYARYQIAQYGLAVSSSERWPDANLALSKRRNQIQPNNTEDKEWRESWNGSVRVSWEPDLWGRLSDTINADTANFNAARMDFMAAQQSLVSRILFSYFDLLEAQKLIALTQSNLSSQQRRVAITGSRLDAGLLSSHDFRLAKNSLHNLESSLVQQKLNFHRAKQTFNLLLGRYPETPVDTLLQPVELPPVELQISPAQMMQQRPDLRAAEYRLTRAYFQRKQADKSRLPSLNFRLNATSSLEELNQFFDWQYWLVSLTSELSQNLFDGGRITAQQKQQAARQDLALAQYKSSLFSSWQEVERGLYSEAALRERHTAIEQAYEQIFAAETRLNRQYEAGLASSFELLNIQERRIRNETELTRAHYAILENRVRLMLALGEPFPVSLQSALEELN